MTNAPQNEGMWLDEGLLATHSLGLAEDSGAERRLTAELVALDLKKARLSENRRRVKPRNAAQILVDRIRSNPSRAYASERTRIYFVRSGHYVKVGRSTCVLRRLMSLQNGNPMPLELMGSFVGVGCDEGFIHDLIERQEGAERGCGEWFTLTQSIVEMIKKLCGQPYHLVNMVHSRKGGANLGRKRPKKPVVLPKWHTREKAKTLVIKEFL